MIGDQIAYWSALTIGAGLIGWHVKGLVRMALCSLTWASVIFLLGRAVGAI